MGFKMRSGNGPLAFKNMGSSSPAKEGGIMDWLKNATVSGGNDGEEESKTPKIDIKPKGQVKKIERQNKKDEKQYMKYLKKNSMEGDENSFDNWKKSDDNPTSKKEARRIKEGNMSTEDYKANQGSKRKKIGGMLEDLGAGIRNVGNPNASIIEGMNNSERSREAFNTSMRNQDRDALHTDLLNKINKNKIDDHEDALNEKNTLNATTNPTVDENSEAQLTQVEIERKRKESENSPT